MRLSISSPPTQRPARDAILSIEPLESIIESEDIQRYIEAQVSDHIIPPVSSMLHDAVEDTIVDDADENYDTDLESDFPGKIFIERSILLNFVRNTSWKMWT